MAFTKVDPSVYQEIYDHIAAATSVVVSGHVSPDGDALGSQLALMSMITHEFPHIELTGILADKREVSRGYRFLEGSKDLVNARKFKGTPDLFISVDTPNMDRLHEASQVAKHAREIVAFDHHPASEEFAYVEARDTGAAACALLILDFALVNQIPVSAVAAEALYTALMTDTGSFQYSNVDQEAFQAAGLLVSLGAQPDKISVEVYQSQMINNLKLKAIVDGRIKLVSDGRVSWSYVTEKDLEETGVPSNELDGLISDIRSIGGVKVAMFFRELKGGQTRVNLRSKGSFDVSAIAESFGGGGHKAASGASVKGSIEEVSAKLISAVESEMVQSDC